MQKRKLSAEKIKENIVNKSLQSVDIFYFDEIDSTNTRAKKYADDGGKTAIFIADRQSGGRGRMGRSFDSAGGLGIYISFLTFPSGNAADGIEITAKAACAVVRAVNSLVNIDAKIKWVNDITVNGKKLAGILTEGKINPDGTFAYAVCGIGINLYKREFPKEIKDIATTLEDESGETVDRALLTARIIEEYFKETDKGDVLSEYISLSSTLGKTVTVYKQSETFKAKAVSINERYELTVERENGETETLCSAEISTK